MKASARLLCASVFLTFCGLALAQSNSPPTAPNQADAKTARHPPRPDRVWMKDVEGIWMSQQFMTALKTGKSPRAAAQKAQPIVVQLKKENGVYPILTTNFRTAVLQFVIEIEPDKKPNSWRFVTAKSEGIVNAADVSYSYFTGKRGKGGVFETLSLKEPHYANRKTTNFVRLDEPLDSFVNRHTVAGKYKDGQGKNYEFTHDGQATFPDRSFAYEVLLDTAQSNCDVLTSHHEKEPDGKEHIGFARSGDTISLFKAQSPSKGRWRCEDKPFATLTRGEPT